MTKISLIVPVCNRELLLPRLLCSIKQQNIMPYEIIFVDNGSTDGSVSCLQQFKAEMEGTVRVQLLSEPLPGANKARNRGAAAAETADYLCFFDSDDELLPEMFETLIHESIIHPHDIIAFTNWFVEESGKTYVKKRYYNGSLSHQIAKGNIATQNFIVRKTIFDQIGGWNESLQRWQDWELVIRLMLHTNDLYWIKEPPLNRFFIHASSITGKNFSKDHATLFSAVDAVSMAIEQSNHSIKVKEQLQSIVDFRFLLLSGLYSQEGNSKLGNHYYHLLKERIAHKKNKRLLFALLYRYIAMGGRGAWIIADYLL